MVVHTQNVTKITCKLTQALLSMNSIDVVYVVKFFKVVWDARWAERDKSRAVRWLRFLIMIKVDEAKAFTFVL